MAYRVLKYNTRLLPTPLKRTFELEATKQSMFGSVCFSQPVASKLTYNTNLIKAESYCFDTQASIGLECESDSPYVISTTCREWVTESGDHLIPKWSALGIKHVGKITLDIPEPTGFMILDSQNNYVYGNGQPETIVLETTDWIAIENIDQRNLKIGISI